MSKETDNETKNRYLESLKIAGPALLALVVGIFVFVLGPFQENRQLKKEIDQYNQPIAEPAAVKPDQLTASSLKNIFAPNQGNLSSDFERAAQASKCKIDSLSSTPTTSNIVVSCNQENMSKFNDALGRYLQILPNGQTRGSGPAIEISKYQMSSVATSRTLYQLEINAKRITTTDDVR